MKEDDVDVFVLRSLIALKLISKKELEEFYRKLAHNDARDKQARAESKNGQHYYGA